MFGFLWDFEILNEIVEADEVIVKGRLTCTCGNKTIVKTQFGNKEIVYKTEPKKDSKGNIIFEEKYGKKTPVKVKTDRPLSLGNDFKAAATDALKKCASEIGIAADIYSKDEFKEVKIKGVEPATKQYE